MCYISQKCDIAKALSEDEVYDFLIDIVPREEPIPSKTRPSRQTSALSADKGTDDIYYNLVSIVVSR